MFDNELVPIRLDVAIDHQRFQDTFCWDSRGSAQAAEAFAENLCHENKLPRAVVPTIVSTINQQVAACKSSNEAAGADELTEERNEIIK